MAELVDRALLIRRIPYGDSSLICHFLSEKYGRITLMARAARRAKSPFRAVLEPFYMLDIRWRPGRRGMGYLAGLQRRESLLAVSHLLDGQQLLVVVSRLFQEGDLHAFDALLRSLQLLQQQQSAYALSLVLWKLLEEAGWLATLDHCWQCDREADGVMFWVEGTLQCKQCGHGGIAVSAGLRRSIMGVCQGQRLLLSKRDQQSWDEMIASLLRVHGVSAR